ncbi:hypothetical protein [Pseudomonas mediterranea]|uniref:hypothetical protein n=1 Tax=Pseudomonas mediterranea TaxID=183795 RepID=UPI000A4759DC|nr:hypothetical protein [Pseudomonas mediterranea]
MTNARMKVLLEKAAETATHLAALVKNPDTKKRLEKKANKLTQQIKELSCE